MIALHEMISLQLIPVLSGKQAINDLERDLLALPICHGWSFQQFLLNLNIMLPVR